MTYSNNVQCKVQCKFSLTIVFIEVLGGGRGEKRELKEKKYKKKLCRSKFLYVTGDYSLFLFLFFLEGAICFLLFYYSVS